ncbi:hypothetical protein [Streptomyces sp. NPDC101234]
MTGSAFDGFVGSDVPPARRYGRRGPTVPGTGPRPALAALPATVVTHG